MKVFKVIIALLLSILLLASTSLVLGSYAVSKALSEEAIEKAIVETGAVDQLTDRILQENTSNLGGGWGDTMKSILKSDSMTEFFSAYTAKCLQGQIYNENYEEIGSDELNAAFQDGIDECIADGSINLSDFERKAFDTALNYSMPSLTKGINYVLEEMDLSSFVGDETAGQIETAKMLASPEVRYAALAASAILCLIIIIMFWRSKMGLIWCGVVILIAAAVFELFGFMLDGTVQSSGENIALSTRMLYVMVAYGLQKIAIIGGIAGAAAFPLCPILRKIF